MSGEEDFEAAPVQLTDLLDEDQAMRVQRQRCGTCIYWNENRMSLEPGRREQMEADADEANSFIACHQTLPYSQYEADPAVCHGYWRHQQREHWPSWPMRVAHALDSVAYVEPPCTTWNNRQE